MKHLGDITKLSGYVVPAVDVVIGGSPCQGLSVAGKQAGLKDERSGLFIEQIRLVKEMRKADAARGKANDAIRPRYMVWENVPGAFSSNQGRDFEAVLEETVRVAEPKAPLFLSLRKDGPQADASWETDGALRGEFSTLSFGEHPISLFHNGDGESRLWQILEEEPQVIASGVDCRSYNVSEGVSGTILAKRISSHFALEYRNPTLDASLITAKNANVAGTLDASYYKGCGMRSGVEREVVVDAIPINDKATRFQGGGATRNQDGAGNGLGVGKPGDPSPTLTAADRHIVFAKTAIAFTERGRKDGRNCETMTDTMYALTNPGDGGRTNSRQVCYAGIVRRLTPLECERLQGYPDGWTDIGSWVDSKGKKHPESSDAARYKALGNSIAIPPWKWVLKRLCAIYERDATMASLFDGIGGFPYIWEQLNGKGSCLWASEIEPFPIAVTKYHFGEE